ncbi:conserved protein of unknown function [Petrocella atlantisensis]|uniref:DUF2953 domain-containing protein n=1 Tax=Petrocella atlantisensis TaxID=2173034 RepID=A0A3P7P805_9FIRM|nr:DUF2953 domain-containing protein [Petrocella atlantisensis]VDN46353.1 conserved protein of unknown function [Petrocella atlantisensis]
MLGIVFIILKSILLALLGLVLLLLLLLNIILWVPIRYQAYGSKYDAILAYGQVDYLFGLIRVRFRYDGDGVHYTVHILWFKVHDSKAIPKKKSKHPKKQTDGKMTYVKNVVVDEKTEVKKKEVKEIEVKEIKIEENKPKTEESNSKEPQISVKEIQTEESKQTKTPKVKKHKKTKDEKSETSTWEQIKSGIELLRSDKHKGVLKFVLGKVHKMVKSILPRRIEADIIFGFADPATTGLVLGGVSMFYPYYGNAVIIIPNFEEVMFEGDIKIRGKIVIGVLVYYGLRVIIDKRVRSIIKAVR